MHGAITERAPAKLNLYLHVLGRRADGYHELDSLVTFTTLADTLKISPSHDLAFTVVGEFAGEAGKGEGNLVMKAARMLKAHSGTREGASLHLTKNIPVGAGLGGGSADAAATLRGLNTAWNLNYSNAQLRDLAVPLGADVAMCVDSAPAIARGIGDLLTPVAHPAFYALLVHPRSPLLTKDIYAALNAPALQKPAPALPALPAEYKPFLRVLEEARNDLTDAALAVNADVRAVLDSFKQLQLDADLVRMTGSGACCFGLYASEAKAHAAAETLRANQPGWWVDVTSSV